MKKENNDMYNKIREVNTSLNNRRNDMAFVIGTLITVAFVAMANEYLEK